MQSDIQENSVIDLLTIKRKNVVFIQMVDSAVLELKVHDFATNVNVVKKQISQILNIPVEYQQLYINTTELHNNDILSDKMIGPETILNLICANLNIRLQLWQECYSCAFKEISLPSNSKLFQIKEHVKTIYKIPIEYQTLYFKDQKLDFDENTLMDYKILNDSYIEIIKDDFGIIIETQFSKPNQIPLRVFPSETVKQVKDKIESCMQWNSFEQKLFWNNSILHDGDILQEKGITSGSHLYLFVVPHFLYLSIEAELGQNIKIVCQTTETVGQLMKKIENATQIPIINQVLYSNNKRWSYIQSCLLKKLNLNESTNIILKREEHFIIFVHILTGKIITLDVTPTETVEGIKCKIEQSEGIPYNRQILFFYCKQLKDERSVASYGITAEATSHLVLSLLDCC